MAVKPKENEIHLSRIYDAPVKQVWEAWTDPVQTAKWWGPRGFTITSHSKDLRPGGIWHYTMHGPDGTNYPNKTVYHVVERYQKLVYDHGGYDDRPPMFRVTVTFAEKNGKTHFEMTMAFPSLAEAEHSKKIIKQANGNSTWDRLAEYLEKDKTGNDIFVINRSFNVPIAKLFQIWTDPTHVSKWLAPKGFRMEFIRAKIEAGGSSFYFMENDGGMRMYGRIEYTKIESPRLLEYMQQFCDADEKISRHPGAPVWPETMSTKVEFCSEGENETRVTISWAPAGKFTDAELQAFIAERSGMTAGWTGSFDKLDEYLKQWRN